MSVFSNISADMDRLFYQAKRYWNVNRVDNACSFLPVILFSSLNFEVISTWLAKLNIIKSFDQENKKLEARVDLAKAVSNANKLKLAREFRKKDQVLISM